MLAGKGQCHAKSFPRVVLCTVYTLDDDGVSVRQEVLRRQYIGTYANEIQKHNNTIYCSIITEERGEETRIFPLTNIQAWRVRSTAVRIAARDALLWGHSMTIY